MASNPPVNDAILDKFRLDGNLSRWGENHGVTFPWNEGLKWAKEVKADAVCVCNSDVVFGKHVIKNCMEALFTGEEKAVFPLSIQGGPFPNDFYKREETLSKTPTVEALVDTGGFAGWCFFLKMSTVEKIGVFDDQFRLWYQDTDYHNRLRKAGIGVYEVRNCLLHHYESRTILSMEGGFDCNGWREKDAEHFAKKWSVNL